MKYFEQQGPVWHHSREAKTLLNENQLQTVGEVLEHEPDLEYGLSQLLLWSDTTIINRLLCWLQGLNGAIGAYHISYKPLVLAILWAFQSDTPIRRQTQHQFEISLRLLQDFLGFGIPLGGHLDARYLLMNLFILSERPDLGARSLKKEMVRYGERGILTVFHKSLDQLLHHLFVQVRLPTFLFPYLVMGNYQVYRTIVQILDGQRLRSIFPAHLKLTKAENALLQKNVIRLPDAKDHILERFVMAARVLKERPNDFTTLNRMLDASKIFKDQFATFENDVVFWQSVFRFLANNREALEEAYVFSHHIDFFEAQRYFCEVPLAYSLKGRTFASVQRALGDWEMNFTYRPEYVSYTWEPMAIEKWLCVKDPFSYIIEEITDGKRLLEESKNLHHCVFGYAKSCQEGYAHIFSLSRVRGNIKKPWFTIEVRGKAIVQIAGKRNRQANDEVMAVIGEWGAANQLHMAV
ncbi:PcfJ domain-containing protein [Maribacter sp. 2307ULW6-5]|uniref:PcfJ domain-containing protein n=1 Tax=Maribacter sp. 2307ULW6-5 TaxID=3386275 RepID=UPI0039BC7D0E